MKLDKKHTILIGFAFLSICAFWQMYDNLIPLILTHTFHISETASGVVMAADNVLALFLLPLFGGISDRCTSRLGRRKPFILVGTLVSVTLMMLLPILSDSYRSAPAAGKLTAFIVILGMLLISMGTYRSPAVALMPDVTPKPLRSKGNAVINLMGAIGSILYLLAAKILYDSADANASFLPLFAVTGGCMLVALAILMLFVDEPKLVKKQQEYEHANPEPLTAEVEGPSGSLPREVKRSLAFLLISISLWFIGYNGVSTWFTVYAQKMWNMSVGKASMCLTIATGGAIVSYLPVGAVASRVGRRRTIQFGTILLSASFLTAFLYTLAFDSFSPILYVLFLMVGVAWASINVNSLPMVVEMCKGSEVGRFTGLYYTFSMAAQIVTPIVAGFLLQNLSYKALFPYAALFVGASAVTISFVKHGDSRITPKRGIEIFDTDD
ncbi:MAG: MFS transporter [Firmicutes bacterium]|nr:MFS transporter [Bacillota bacterium]